MGRAREVMAAPSGAFFPSSFLPFFLITPRYDTHTAAYKKQGLWYNRKK